MKGVLHRPEKSDILNPESISNFLEKGENGMEHLYEKALESAEYIKTHTKKRPKIAVVLGSGLGKLTADFTDTEELSYKDIPNFPVSTVAGHKGALLAGKLGDTEVYAMEGRFHFYEGYSMKEVCYPFYVFKLLGVEKVVLTNACGGINREFAPGTLMLITDFINMMGTNPLIGPNDERFGPRFPDMTEPYSLELRNLAKQTADELGIAYKEGVYMGFMGPCYETAAEIRAFAGMGADAVGMSTVPETMVCNYMGMKVLAVSCITNMATGIQTVKHSHARVLEIANQAGDTLCRWLGAVIQRME
jgi:purine-nucleoside phosphorylase